MNTETLFNNKADITTYGENDFKIRRKYCYINGRIDNKLFLYVRSKNNTKNNDLHVIEEVYGFEEGSKKTNPRIRFRCTTYYNPVIFKTIEKDLTTGVEKNIIFLENYEYSKNAIKSIGNIKDYRSDTSFTKKNSSKLIFKDNKKKRTIL